METLKSRDLEGALLRLGDDVFLVGARLPPVAESEGTRVVMLPEQLDSLELLFSAAVARPYAEREGLAVQLEQEGEPGWAGVEVDEESDFRRLASVFGALALTVGASDITQLTDAEDPRWALARSDLRPVRPRLHLPFWR